MKGISFSVSLVVYVWILLGGAHAQTFTGGISGVVKDPAGAVVPGTQLILVNTGTGEKRMQMSNDSGGFTFTAISPGDYRLEAEKEGFKKVIQAPIEVRVQQFINLELVLEIGETSETLQVTESVPLVDASTSSLGYMVESVQVHELPLNGRNTLAFIEFTPGVRSQGGFGANPANVNFQAFGNFSANGGLANANEVLVDGAPVTTASFSGVAFVPPVDATREFRIQTNAFPAEFGRTSGAVVNLSIKSGTNDLHGTIYEFLRNDKLDANNFFLNRAGRPRPVLRFNQFGAAVGGPIIKDKTFFFGNYEGFRQRKGIALTTTVPTALERRGDFSQSSRIIRDPFTKQPFPGNTIPASQLDPVGVRFAQPGVAWPLPNTPGTRTAAGDVINNFSTSESQASDVDQVVVRIDHSFNDKWKLFGTYGLQDFRLGGFDPFKNGTTTFDGGRAEDDRFQHFVLSATSVFSPHVIGEYRGSFTRSGSSRIPMTLGFDLTSLGFPKSVADAAQVKTFPVLQVQGQQAIDVSTTSNLIRNSTNFTGSAGLTLIRNSHTLKIGGQVRTQSFDDFLQNNGSPTFAFDGRFTDTLGFGLPSMLLGFASSGNIGVTQATSLIRKYLAGYVQDDWKVNQKLTLNLGLRWGVDAPPTERFNRLARFDRTIAPPLDAVIDLPLRGGLVFADNNSRRVEKVYWRQWDPRFGFAYQLRPSTVVRGGYGIYWLPFTSYSFAFPMAPGFTVTTPFVSSLDGGITPRDKISNPFPNGITQPPGNSPNYDTLVTNMAGLIGQVTEGRRHPGYVQNWNLNIQQDLGNGIAIDGAYAGSRSVGLPAFLYSNQLDPQFISLGDRLNEQVPNPFFGHVKTGTLAQQTVSRGQLLRPFPQFENVTVGAENIGNSVFHSFQFKFTKRFDSASQIAVAYTLSKNIGDSFSGGTVFNEPGGEPSSLDFYNRKADRSLVTYDAPHRLVLNSTYEIPFGKGMSGLRNKIIADWEVTGIYTLQSGTPLFLFAPDLTNTFINQTAGFGLPVRVLNRPNSTGQSGKLSGDPRDRLNRFFDTSAFSQPPRFTFGNVSKALPDVRNHSINNFDFGLFKNNRFGRDGHYNLQFRAEFFNVFNRVRFGNPGNFLGQANFGVIANQANEPRLVQFALKFLF
ncbi:MAG: TonB-dependent receptor [Acidobacteria bacterium]|nr:TonB-dependent receptor [Acidobacteriota bacterium]